MTTDKNSPKPLMEALDIINAALADPANTPPVEKPTRLDRKEIVTMVSVFQPRELDGRWTEDERHIDTLKAVIGNPERPTYLDPLTVWRGGDRWYVIDGHHRLVAYDRAKVRRGIPVVVFEGTLDEARAESAAANSKDRLVMRLEDKLGFAWRLTVTTTLSKARTAEACAVSNGTIGNMRGVKQKLLEEHNMTLEDLAETPWTQARTLAEGKEMQQDYDPDEAVQKRADGYRKRLYKAFGDIPTRDSEAFALAMRLSNDRLPRDLMQSRAWEASLRQTLVDLKEELADAEAMLSRWPEKMSDADDY